MAEIVMPRLSDTMEEGTILRWLKRDGDTVARGEQLVEIETDKATMTYESDQHGVLEIVAGEGSTLAVGALIARVGVAGGGESAGGGAAAVEGVEGPAPEGPAGGSGVGEPRPADGAAVADVCSRPATPVGGDGSERARGRVKASPLARRVARESGIDLRGLAGSGPGGRIVRADVLAAPAGAPSRAASSSATAAAGASGEPASAGAPSLEGVTTAKGETTTVQLTRTQRTIARRMAESKATIPDFTLQIEVDMEACVALRTELKRLSQPAGAGGPDAGAGDAGGVAGEGGDAAGEGGDAGAGAHIVPTYNDMVVKAAALALGEHPRANGSYRDARVQLHSRVNVGVAVAAEGALVVPTVFDADSKALGEIARETRALAERVRAGTITPPELGGGTFTVSNLGMYGVRSFSAIINPPQAGILSVGSMEPRAVVRDGELVARNTMTLTLACDHRILYGAEAALFLARIRELLEAPAALTL